MSKKKDAVVYQKTMYMGRIEIRRTPDQPGGWTRVHQIGPGAPKNEEFVSSSEVTELVMRSPDGALPELRAFLEMPRPFLPLVNHLDMMQI